MLASEARKIYDDRAYNEIMSAIEKQANEGIISFIWYKKSMTKTLRERLEKEGYSITLCHGGKSWPGYQISF